MISYAIEYRNRPLRRCKWNDDDWGNLWWFRDLKEARKNLREEREEQRKQGAVYQYRLLRVVSKVIR
jgi:hypothetical protein